MSIAPMTSISSTPHWFGTLSARQKADCFTGLSIPNEDLPASIQPYAADPESSETTRVTGANGASVAVTRVYEANYYDTSYTLHLGAETGTQLDLAFKGDLTVSKTEDGIYAVYFANENLTRSYAADGSCMEAAGDQTGADAGKIFISTSGAAIQGGAGDETFLIYTAPAYATCCASINTGEGDNTIILKDPSFRGDLTTGDGNNRIICDGDYAGSMTLGDGDNIVSIGSLTGHINTGNGDSSFSIGAMRGTIKGGFGAENLQSPQRTFNIASMSGHSALNLGNGATTLNIGSISGNSSIIQMFGEINLNIDCMSGSSKALCLTTNPSVTVGAMSGTANIHATGNASVRVDEMSGSSTLSIGGHAAELWGLLLEQSLNSENAPTYSSEVYIGEMRDSATLSLGSYISEQLTAIGAMYDNARLTTESLDWFIQNGNTSNVNIVVGTADESAELPREHVNVSILSDFEQEDLPTVQTMLAEWRTEREAAGLTAAKQDLWAALNGKVSNEEKLLQRVAMLVSWNY